MAHYVVSNDESIEDNSHPDPNDSALLNGELFDI